MVPVCDGTGKDLEGCSLAGEVPWLAGLQGAAPGFYFNSSAGAFLRFISLYLCAFSLFLL